MATLALAQTGLKKDGSRPLVKDAFAAIPLLFERGPAKIKTLETLDKSMLIRAWSNNEKAIPYENNVNEIRKYNRYRAYARLSFHIVSKMQEKIGKMLAERGEYLQASDAYSKAGNAYGRALTSGDGDGQLSYGKDGAVQLDRKDRRLFGMDCYYLGKHEATAKLEESIWANVAKADHSRTSMISFAAASIEQAFGAFMEAGETGWAIKAGKEAASLYAQVGENRKALAICDKTAAYAKENHMAFELISIYELAASIAQDRGQAASYLELARGAVEEWIRRLQGPVSFYSPNPGLL